MLVLSRKKNTGLVILDTEDKVIGRISIVDIDRGVVRVGIEGDKSRIRVLRDELINGKENNEGGES